MSLLHGTSEEIITLLLEVYPKAASVCHNECLPIHDALRDKKSDRLIQLLLDAYPLATEKRDDAGLLPLCLALSTSSSHDIVKMVFEAYPQAVQFPVNENESVNILPLHYALENNASDCTIKMLLNAHPMAAEIEGEGGWLPLNYAVHNGVSTETILMLLDKYPEAAQTPDYWGSMPLHAVPWAVTSTRIVDALLEAYPDAAREIDNQGKIPLHHACSKKLNKNSLISIQSLISAYPEGIDVEDDSGFLPSHYLTKYLTSKSMKGHKNNQFLLHMAVIKNFSKHLVTLLVRGYPQLCLKRDNHGKIPLHYACEGKMPSSLHHIVTLLNACAESLYVEDWQSRTPRQILSNTVSRKDKNKMLPLHHLAAASDVLLPESLQLLVDVYPESIITADNHGLLPIHYACLNPAISVDGLMQFIKLYPEGIVISK